MEEQTKRKLQAAGKMALGAYKMTSSVLVVTGHGLVGSFLARNGVRTSSLAPIMKHEFKSGQEDLERGWEAWKSA